MRFRSLGRSGVQVSELSLGTMMFGGETDERGCRYIVDAARDAGVNAIATVDVYHGGASERIVGELIRPDRSAWILSTEVGGASGTDPDSGGLSRRWLMRAIDASLGRLRTDYVDLWYLHLDDRRTSLEETIAAVADVIAAGKVRHWGFSNFFGWQVAEMVRICDLTGAPRPVAAQPLYHALNRSAESDYLPACAHFGIGAVAYSPLARGVLTGKYTPGRPPPAESRAGRGDARMLESEYRPEALEATRKIKERAKARGTTAAALALRWALNNGLIASVIAGPRTAEQWAEYAAALEAPFTGDDEAFFDGLIPSGHATPDGFSDPRYPFTGRRPLVGAPG